MSIVKEISPLSLVRLARSVLVIRISGPHLQSVFAQTV